MTRLIANNFSTTLNGAITDVATSMTLTSVTGFPAVGGGDTCQVTLDDGAGNIEIVTATAIAGSVITITRAQEGTTGFAFADLDPVEIRDTALLYTDVLASDTTPALAGPLDASLAGAYVGFGGSSSATAYCLNHSGNVPVLRGAANYWYTFTSSSCDYQAGTSWYKVQMHNSNGFSVTTNNVVRIQANNSGVQFGATGARITSVIDDDTMATASATTLATSESIKAYADSVGGGGAPEGTAVLSTGEVGGTKFLREDGDGTCSWQNATSTFTPSSTDTLTNKTIDANGTGNSISNIDIADLANGTDGELITWDASGAPAAVAVGTVSYPLVSGGAGVAPTFAVLPIAGGGTGVTALPAMLANVTSTQAVSSAVFTKIAFATVSIDTESDYDNTTYLFTPSIAGVYMVVATVMFDAASDQMQVIARVAKNTVPIADNITGASGTSQAGISVGTVVSMNGTTDYIEVQGYQNSGVSKNANVNCILSACWVGES